MTSSIIETMMNIRITPMSMKTVMTKRGNSVVTDVQFGHLFLVCIKYVALQEVTCGLFRKISHCS